MFKFLKKNPKGKIESESSDDSNFMKAVHSHMIDRRQHPRVKYPVSGPVGFLPTIVYEGQKIVPTNLSTGGLQLSNPPIGAPQPGKIYTLKFIWPPKMKETIEEAELLRTVEGQWHFKFKKNTMEYSMAFAMVAKMGLRGIQAAMLENAEISEIKDLLEMWVSTAGDFVSFHKAGESENITMAIGGAQMRFSEGKLLKGDKSADGIWTYQTLALPAYRDEAILFLVNLRSPTLRIQNLIKGISVSTSSAASAKET